MLHQVFVSLMENAEELKGTKSSSKIFNAICSRFGLENVAYLGVNLPKKTNKDFYVHNTYSREWSLRYETQNYIKTDPIIRLGLHGIMPIDWSDLGALTGAQKNFLGEANEFKIGTKGLSFPLRGLYGETAVFSISANMSERDWSNFKLIHLREMRVISDLIHQNVLDENINPIETKRYLLTEREKECLKWTAEGKTYQDISDILGISVRTVRFFLEGARTKLSCNNSTHTVVVAMQRGYI